MEKPCSEEVLACPCVLLTFAAITTRVPPGTALLCLSVLVRSFLMWATATRSNSCCFRSVITGAFGFWTGGKVAAAAAGRSADQR